MFTIVSSGGDSRSQEGYHDPATRSADHGPLPWECERGGSASSDQGRRVAGGDPRSVCAGRADLQ